MRRHNGYHQVNTLSFEVRKPSEQVSTEIVIWDSWTLRRTVSLLVPETVVAEDPGLGSVR